MALEFAIFDDQGKQFGLPARSWPDREAADSTLAFLRSRRRDLEQAAHDAQQQLDFTIGKSPMGEHQRRELENTVEIWNREKERVYSVLVREVGQWQTA